MLGRPKVPSGLAGSGWTATAAFSELILEDPCAVRQSILDELGIQVWGVAVMRS